MYITKSVICGSVHSWMFFFSVKKQKIAAFYVKSQLGKYAQNVLHLRMTNLPTSVTAVAVEYTVIAPIYNDLLIFTATRKLLMAVAVSITYSSFL